MSNSALVGQAPVTTDDELIIRGYARTLGMIDNVLDPSQIFRLSIVNSSQHGAKKNFQNASIAASMSLAIALIVLITGTRLGLRVFQKDLSISYDDFVIVPAAIVSVAWFSITIAMLLYGDTSQHIYDVTYSELNAFYRVRLVLSHTRLREIN